MTGEPPRRGHYRLLKDRWSRWRSLVGLKAPRVIVQDARRLVAKSLFGCLAPSFYRLWHDREYDRTTCPNHDGWARCLLDRGHDGDCEFKPWDPKIGKCEICGDESPRVECAKCKRLVCPNCYGFLSEDGVEFEEVCNECLRGNETATVMDSASHRGSEKTAWRSRR